MHQNPTFKILIIWWCHSYTVSSFSVLYMYNTLRDFFGWIYFLELYGTKLGLICCQIGSKWPTKHHRNSICLSQSVDFAKKPQCGLWKILNFSKLQCCIYVQHFSTQLLLQNTVKNYTSIFFKNTSIKFVFWLIWLYY